MLYPFLVRYWRNGAKYAACALLVISIVRSVYSCISGSNDAIAQVLVSLMVMFLVVFSYVDSWKEYSRYIVDGGYELQKNSFVPDWIERGEDGFAETEEESFSNFVTKNGKVIDGFNGSISDARGVIALFEYENK